MPKRKTQEEFISEVKELFDEEYVVLGQYVNNRTKILIKHTKCGNEFYKNPKDMITKKSGCPYCCGSRPALYNEQWVKEHTPAPYCYISGYQGMKQKCLFYCNKCKKTFEQLPARLINQGIFGCGCCPTKKKTHQQFLEDLGDDTLQHYKVLNEYVNADVPITFKHIDCDTVFSLSPEKFLHRYNKQYCPVCYYKKSRGEISILESLKNIGVKYKKEYIFPDLPKFRYDFYLPDLNACIEFDGKQHFEAIGFFGGEKALKYTQTCDAIKNQYCINNHISLYRIPYSDIDNISSILHLIFEEKSSETIEKYKIY